MKAELLPFADLIGKFPSDPVISLAGAGGKTTLLFRIARCIGNASVVTATTKVGAEQIASADVRVTCGDFSPRDRRGVVWVSPSLEPVNGKIIGCSVEKFRTLAADCQRYHIPLINEADGAARRHVKAPAAHEPVIPPETNVCFYLVGLDVLGRPVTDEFVHRPEIFAGLTESRINEPISADHILRLLDHPYGGLKNIPPSALKVAYLTHADTEERLRAGKYIAQMLKNYHYICLS